jgi:putative oxidoreductase
MVFKIEMNMKKILFKTFQETDSNLAILILRAGSALMMLTHGIPKLMQFFSDEPIAFANIMGMGMTLSLALAVMAEVFCSVCILLGAGTRFAAIPLIVTMLTAAFYIHASDSFAGKEMSLLYALIFTVLLFTGGGKYSVDNILSGKLRKKAVTV